MRWRRSPLVLVATLVLALVACSSDGGARAAQQPEEPQGPNFPVVVFHSAGGHTARMTVEVVDTPELTTCGLMHRLAMAENHGMLFVFAVDSAGPFWNRNTFIPLTLAWIAADGTIVDLTDMAAVSPRDNPQINSNYWPRASYRYVIEANQGWFARNGIAIGDRVDLSEALARGSEGAVPLCRELGL